MHHFRRGFISIRTLIALLITITLLPLSISVMSFSAKIPFNYEEIENEISLSQLRRLLLFTYDLNNNGSSLDFIYKNEYYSISEINNRLVLQPGYQVFLDKVDNIYFYEQNNAYWLSYRMDNKKYETPIVKKNGIYIEQFSSDTD